MGFMRKGLFLASGGMSGVAGVKANSKKERIAKALEKQNRQGQMSAAFEKTQHLSSDAPLTKVEKQAARDRQLLSDADRGWRSGRVLTSQGKRRVAELRRAQTEAATHPTNPI